MQGKQEPGARYTVTLAPNVESDLERIATTLHISKAEAFRRALTLFSHAVEADEVVLTTNGKERSVLLK